VRGLCIPASNQNKGGAIMQAAMLYKVVKTVGWVVLLLMVAAIIYACSIGVLYWSGIGV